MSDYAQTLINRVRRNPDSGRDDILALCCELEARLDKPRKLYKKPDIALRHLDPRAYMRLYMRWYRENGQAA